MSEQEKSLPHGMCIIAIELRSRWKCNIKMDLSEVGLEGVEWI
jgi:hypothetical protein